MKAPLHRRLWFVKLMIWLHVWCDEDPNNPRRCRRCGWPAA